MTAGDPDARFLRQDFSVGSADRICRSSSAMVGTPLLAAIAGFSVTPAPARGVSLTSYVASIDCTAPYVKPSRAERLAVKDTRTVGYSCIEPSIDVSAAATTITEYLDELAPTPKDSCASLSCYLQSLEEADECALL